MNEDCGIFHKMLISTTELCIRTENVDDLSVQSMPSLKIAFGKDKIKTISMLNYIYAKHYKFFIRHSHIYVYKIFDSNSK